MKLQKLWKNRKDNITTLTSIASPVISQTNNYVQYIDKTKAKNKIKEPYKIDTLKKDKKLEVLWGAYNKIEALKTSIDSNENSIRDTVKQHNKIVIYQQRIVSYSFTCYLFDWRQPGVNHQKRRNGTTSYHCHCHFHHLLRFEFVCRKLVMERIMNPYLAT
jgi:cell fate (sporulation/competence/biofilm development) regulator YmcA (YheA/YmcA/DUF963 family)